jgi:hypothetical protein
VTYPYGGKFVNTASTCLNAEYHCSGMSKFFFLYSFLPVSLPPHYTRQRIQKKNNFEMPLQLYSALRLVAAVLTNFPPFEWVTYLWRRVYLGRKKDLKKLLIINIFLDSVFRSFFLYYSFPYECLLYRHFFTNADPDIRTSSLFVRVCKGLPEHTT